MFGGVIYFSATRRLEWRATLEVTRSLRAGFDAVTFAAPGTSIAVTALMTDAQGTTYSTSAVFVVGSRSAVEARVVADPNGITSGQGTQLRYWVQNRSISDTTFALTTTLPVEAHYLNSPFTATTTYNAAARTINWQRPLKADRQALAVAVISATQGLQRSIGFTTTFTSTGTAYNILTRLIFDPIRSFLPLIAQKAMSPASATYLVSPIDHPFEGRGTPPGSINNLIPPVVCQGCHNVAGTPIYQGWANSAHGYAASDPVFNAALTNARQQVQDVDRWCTQCHRPANWLAGHPLNEQDQSGITCSVCHRAVDATSGELIDQPANERAQAMGVVPPRWKEIGGSGALIVDHNDVRRGTNFANVGAPHQIAQSPFQGSSAFCGSCHSVYALHLAPDPVTGEFVLGKPDLAHGENPLFLQSTYPEWLHSQYATQDKQCQDCHLPFKFGYAADPAQDGQMRFVPLHNFAGGNLFILDIFDQIGGLADTSEARAAVTNMLTQSVAITPTININMLDVDVTCLSGHKCPTGYEEGRAWILQVEQLDLNGQRVACSGCWDEVKHTISGYGAGPTDPDYDPELAEFAIHFGVTGTHALRLGLTPGPSFNLALNNTVISDTRIPPCGWDATAYRALGIAPTVSYASGSCTATVHYSIHPTARQIVVRVLHWSHTTPYLEFLREVGGDFGRTVWDAWQANLNTGEGRPFVITSQTVNLP
jgi:hypothetical protein